jgi:parvulin-like peptidyl-prolyl isomerase
MKKFFFLLLLLGISFGYAKMLDGIAIIVNGEPVTTAEIRAVERQTGASKKQAIDLLIQDRLQKAAMKDITVPETDIDTEVERIAKQNGISIGRMQQILKGQGTSWSKYRNSIREALKKRIFFREKVAKNIPMPTEDELKLFYQNHHDQFTIPSAISVIEYSAKTEGTLNALIKNGHTKGVSSKHKILQTKRMNPALMSMLMQTPEGRFTRPINAGNRYVAYKIISKTGRTQMPFGEAKNMVAARWQQQQQEKALKDYFKKMKTEANIRILRK